MLIGLDGIAPRLAPTAYVQATAQVIGDVELADDASVWFHSVLRGDGFPIRIGARSNIQDNSTLHVATGRHATVVGADVTVGHNVVLHACTIGDRCLIGIGAIVLDRCLVGDDCMIGAGALLTPGTVVPPGHLALGSPAKVVRPLSDGERAHIAQSAANYVLNAARYRAQGI
ncbi:MAG: gamma carbonic anhydrase family protein [Deltaproteobacteria bacterium]|nr:gamma carbonic anhydrase family protein [Deltaproteobacteria bacterium]